MLSNIEKLGTPLSKEQQSKIKGGTTCSHTTADFDIQVTKDAIGYKLYVDGSFSGYLSGNIEANAICSRAAQLEREEWGR